MDEDEEFINIFNHNNMDKILDDAAKVDLTIKDLQIGVSALSQVTAFLTEFLVEFYEAVEMNQLQDTPKLTKELIIQLNHLFENADCFLDLLDVESDDMNDDEKG